MLTSRLISKGKNAFQTFESHFKPLKTTLADLFGRSFILSLNLGNHLNYFDISDLGTVMIRLEACKLGSYPD